jgi:transporter family-2 protein
MEKGIILSIFLGLAAGIAVAFQGAVNTLLSKTVGIWEANFWVHITGAIALSILLFIGLGQGSLLKIGEAPKISLIGGLLGMMVVSGTIYVISKLGVSTALALLIFAQLLTAGLIDHYGWLGIEQVPFSLQRGAAILFLIVGVILMKR